MNTPHISGSFSLAGHRLKGCAASVIFCLLIAVPHAATVCASEPVAKTPKREWTKAPAVVEVTTPQAVYALGDVHGDYDRMVKVLAAAGLIAKITDDPAALQWKGGKAILVCTGDLIDKGTQSIKVISAFQQLQPAAVKDGGRVVVTMGNHEAEFLNDCQSEKVKEFAGELTAHGIKPADVVAGTDSGKLGLFLNAMPLAAKVNDWFFCHAGNTQGRKLTQLQMELSDWVDVHGYLIGDDATTPLFALLNDRMHPFPWWQTAEKEDKDQAKMSQDRLAQYVAALGAKHLVFGHQPGKVKFSDGTQREAGKAFQNFDGLVFMIDVGMSDAINDSKGAILHIHKGNEGKVTVVFPDGPEETLWPK